MRILICGAGVIGSSNLDQGSPLAASLEGHLMAPILHGMLRKGKLPTRISSAMTYSTKNCWPAILRTGCARWKTAAAYWQVNESTCSDGGQYTPPFAFLPKISERHLFIDRGMMYNSCVGGNTITS